LDDINEEIKINWKDLDRSNILASFPKFRDKALIKKVMEDLRGKRPPIRYFQFNKYSLGFAAVFIYLGMMKVLGF